MYVKNSVTVFGFELRVHDTFRSKICSEENNSSLCHFLQKVFCCVLDKSLISLAPASASKSQI